MLEQLRFVQGAVAKKDFVAALTHFRIADGFIKGSNGAMSLCSPISMDLEVMPKAIPFIKAIQTCKETIALHVTPAGKLSVKSGKFKALIECLPEDFPDVEPEGVLVEAKPGLCAILKKMLPFIAEDASRPWARGILLRGYCAYATNNVCIIEHYLGHHTPVEINIPRMAVAEIVRIGEDPISLQMGEDNVTFHYPGGRWLKTQLYTVSWPDISRILERDSAQQPITEGVWESLKDLLPFLDPLERVFLRNGEASTCPEDASGANCTLDIPQDVTSAYNLKQLLLLEGIAKTIDWHMAPSPCIFYGDNLRGAIVGMRV